MDILAAFYHCPIINTYLQTLFLSETIFRMWTFWHHKKSKSPIVEILGFHCELHNVKSRVWIFLKHFVKMGFDLRKKSGSGCRSRRIWEDILMEVYALWVSLVFSPVFSFVQVCDGVNPKRKEAPLSHRNCWPWSSWKTSHDPWRPPSGNHKFSDDLTPQAPSLEVMWLCPGR